MTDPAQSAAAATPDPRKEAALVAARAFEGDEAGAVQFILQCPYSDARGVAAAFVHTPALVEQVWQAVRNTDRRVAKLMQQRLDAFKRSELSTRQALHCIATAERLLAAPRLLANEVVDLDHAWQIAGEPATPEVERFAVLRAQLAARLEHQADLQHDLLDLLARLRRELNAPQLARAEAETVLQQAAAALGARLADAEAPNLPANLMHELDNAHQSLAARLATETEPLPPPAAAAPAAKPAAKPAAEDGALRRAYADAFAGLEKALQEGALHSAEEFDQALRATAAQGLRLNDKQHQQLAAARAELARLAGWARWGGQVSREELLKAAQDLPAQGIAPAELAKKVGALRASWKALDATLGAAPRDAWQKFDAACSTAYAPAAAHFKKLAEERSQNRERAEALVAEARGYQSALSAPAGAEAADWKKLAHFVDWAHETWKRSGAMDRKERKRLDGEFAAAVAPLEAALAEKRAEEVKRREEMIAAVAKLNTQQRGALDRLRQLQERWQQAARALPLERRQEQAMWQKFRAACDALYAARKESAQHADAERKDHLAAREALCAALEAAVDGPENQLQKILRESREAWSRAGEVPRAVEKKIEARYHKAVDAIQARLEKARRHAADALGQSFADKLALCQRAEQGGDAEELKSNWSALPALPKAVDQALRQRFDAALAGKTTAALLEKNRAVFAGLLLQAEIVYGIASPAEEARERMAMQVEVLRSTLKGSASDDKMAPLLRLAELPAAPDEARLVRLLTVAQRALRGSR